MNRTASKTLNITPILFLLGYVFLLLLNIFLANHLGLKDYGDYKIFESFVAILAPITIMGSKYSACIFIPSYINNNKIEKVLAFLLFFICIGIFFSAALYFTPRIISLLYRSASQLTLLKIHPALEYLAIIPIVAIFSLITRILNNSILHPTISAFCRIAFPLVFLIILFLFSLEEPTQKLSRVITIYGLVYFAFIILLIFIFARTIKKITSIKKSDFHIKTWLSESVRTLLIELAICAMIQADLLILEALGAHEYQVGVFGAILSVTFLFWVIYDAEKYKLTPKLYALIKSNNTAELQNNLTRFRNFFLITTAPLLFLLCGFPSIVLHLFHTNLTQYKALFEFICIGTWLSILNSSRHLVISIAGVNKISLKICLVVLTMLIISEVILVPKFQIWGAAIPMIGSRLLISWFSAYYCKKHFGLSLI